MKQQITKELLELSMEESEELRDWQIEHYCWDKKRKDRVEFETNVGISIVMPMSIGQMIEFLGGDLYEIKYQGVWILHTKLLDYDIQANELCDALFEAVKYKLKVGI